MKITEHSKDRGKERLGLSKKAFENLAIKAFEKGMGVKDFKKSSGIKAYLDALFLKGDESCKCGAIKVYGEYVYFFTHRGMLKTVLQIPNNLRNYKLYLNEKDPSKEKPKAFKENTVEIEWEPNQTQA